MNNQQNDEELFIKSAKIGDLDKIKYLVGKILFIILIIH